MPLNIVKLCVGAQTVGDQEAWIARRVAMNAKAGRGRVHDHVTRMHPRRKDELLDGGSIYWVIKGNVQARQKIVGFETRTGEDGVDRCGILLAPELVLTEPQPRRAFQGWRYLECADTPADISGKAADAAPLELRLELAGLGLL